MEQTKQIEETELNDMKVFPVQSFSMYYFRQIIIDTKITTLFFSLDKEREKANLLWRSI